MTNDELRALYEDILAERARIKAERRAQGPVTSAGAEGRSDPRGAPVAAAAR